MSEDIRPFEVQSYNPGVHELAGHESMQPSAFRRVVAVGMVVLAGIGIHNRMDGQSAEAQSFAPPAMPELITPEVASPEIAQINLALGEIKLGQPNNLDNLVTVVKAADAAFAPHDKDRLPGMPAGYVKFLLPNEATGINVPYTVAERTEDNERYTSAETAAQLYAVAKLYQDLIKTKYPQLEGEMLRVRDLNSKFHKGHKTGGKADISGAFGWNVTQYATGALADRQFSKRFRADFTTDMAINIAGLHVGGKPVVEQIVYSDQSIIDNVNKQVGRRFMVHAKWHDDHFHEDINATLPNWSPLPSQYVWNEDQDLRIGGMAVPITPEQHASQHADFESWVQERFKQAAQLQASLNEKAPESYKPEPLTSEAGQLIDSLDIDKNKKAFLKLMVPSISSVYKAGNKINPVVALAQTSIETGFGDDKLSHDYNNYFGMKVGKDWKGRGVNLNTLEEYVPGKVEPIKDDFRVYPNVTSSIADYARLIQSRPWYDDAEANYQNIEGYINGLFGEADSSGNVIRPQGAVPSYGTDLSYVPKLHNVIGQYDLPAIMSAQLRGES